MQTQKKWMIGGAVVLALGGYYWFFVRKPAPIVPGPGVNQNAGVFQSGNLGSGSGKSPAQPLDVRNISLISQGVWQQQPTQQSGTLGNNPGDY